MIKFLPMLITFFIFTACSLPDFKTHPNAWQHKSASAFNSYTKNFLRANDAIAKSDLKRAIAHAKHSADLTSLARIYLGECALHVSVGIKDTCQKYNEISNLINSKELEAYKNFITKSINKSQINLLPKHYQNYTQKDILSMPKITSKLLSATLIKDKLHVYIVKQLIKDSSYYGYKKAVIFWLKELKTKTLDIKQKKRIDKKISILNSK